MLNTVSSNTSLLKQVSETQAPQGIQPTGGGGFKL